MSAKSERSKAISSLSDLLPQFDTAMLVTIQDDNRLVSRPMINANDEFEGELWFFTLRNDPKAKEVQVNPSVNVSFSDPSKRSYLSISGNAKLITDDLKHKESKWHHDILHWFPKGPSDPELALIRIDVLQAEYWDEHTGMMRAFTDLLGRDHAKHHPKVKHAKVDWE